MKSKLLSIILRKVAYGESDCVVTFLSRDRGRIAGFAKSARSSIKRFGSSLEVGTLAELEISEPVSGKMARIDSAVVKRSVNGLSKSLERISAMNRVVELALKFLQEDERTPDKFDLLAAYLSFISENDPDMWDALTLEYKWLSLCGFRPVLSACAVCGMEDILQQRIGFDVVDGGFVCAECAKRGRATIYLSKSAIEGFCAIENESLRTDDESAKAALQVISRYVDHVAGKKFMTSPIFEFTPAGAFRCGS